MTRAAAARELRRLGYGLPSGPAGAWRLLERVSQHGEAELLRALLAEAGAERLLEELAE